MGASWQRDPDAPPAVIEPEEQKNLCDLAARVSLFYTILKEEEVLPESLIHELTVEWLRAVVGLDE